MIFAAFATADSRSRAGPGRLDNAVIDAFHSTLEFEPRALEHFATRAQARSRTAAWIDEYNRDYRHSAIGMMSPVALELAQAGNEAP